ncbi:putative intracellular septation protein A [mine drainage metagenome]|jgi:intracellular septation protein|uniref:Putative intracellular septation protein A n=1 Tax=mine drainage metagenome TaxID=410659 RepID=A0A1J5R562_9ZZZZ
MKLLFDFLPIILFFAAFKVGGIYVATAVAIAATFGQIGWLRLRGRRVEPMLWVSLVVVVVFGGATLVLHDDTFIKWKPTVLYWLFAAALLGGQLLWRRNLIRSLLGSQMQLPERAWTRLNWSWAGYFTVMGLANIWVAYHYPTATWVDFKLFGSLALTVVFAIGQSLLIARDLPQGS